MAGHTYNYGAPSSVNLFPGASLVNHGELYLAGASADAVKQETKQIGNKTVYSTTKSKTIVKGDQIFYDNRGGVMTINQGHQSVVDCARMENLVYDVKDGMQAGFEAMLKEIRGDRRALERSDSISKKRFTEIQDILGTEIVKTILNKKDTWIQADELEKEVKLYVSSNGFTSFRELSGLALNDFLSYKRCYFDVKQIPGTFRKIVKIRKQKTKDKSRNKQTENKSKSEETNLPPDENNASDTHINSEANDSSTIVSHYRETDDFMNIQIAAQIPMSMDILTESTKSSSPMNTSISDNENIDCIPPTIQVDSVVQTSKDDATKKVAELFEDVHNFSKGSFVLMSGNVPCTINDVEGIGLVPWVTVFDFDPDSQNNGLLNMAKPVLGTKRSLKVSKLGEPLETLSDMTTQWCLLSDQQDIQQYKTESEIVDSNAWFHKNKKAIEAPILKIGEYVKDFRTMTVVLLWPQQIEHGKRMVKMLDRLNFELDHTPKVVVCIQPEASNPTPVSLIRLKDDFGDNLHIYEIDLNIFCSSLKRLLHRGETDQSYILPCGKEMCKTNISAEDAAWLSEDLDVLYVNKPFASCNFSDDEVKKTIEHFYKGGTIEWPYWYTDSIPEYIVERCIQKVIETKLKQRLQQTRSSYFVLNHAPGSGGSTLARSVLWKLHSDYVCAHIKFHPGFIQEEFERRIMYLHEQSRLPTLLLVDDDMETNHVFLRRLPNTVILFVKRSLDASSNDNEIFLAGSVTKQESHRLYLKLEPNCGDAEKRMSLEQLRNSAMKGYKHQMFEFGMAVFQHEFKGIVSFVKGHLGINSDDVLTLTPEQTCLGFLALIDYYGHTGIPCSFFAELFKFRSQYVLDIDDLPLAVSDMVVADTRTDRKDTIRICHWLVSKEILDQLLSREIPDSQRTHRTNEISSRARKQLFSLSRDFIEYAAEKNNSGASCIRSVLIKAFIIREKHTDSKTRQKKKSMMSKLLTDIPEEPPLFTQRFLILQLLVTKFPDNPSFHAHLGRFHAYCRREFDNAQNRFEIALRLCDGQTEGKRMCSIENSIRWEIKLIFHMYGSYRGKYLRLFAGNMQVDEIVASASVTCTYFERSRDMCPESHPLEVFDYTDEIQIRLFVSDLLHKFQLKNMKNDQAINFLADCVEKIPLLLRKCDFGEKIQPEIVRLLGAEKRKYKRIFHDHQIDFIQMQAKLDSISKRRLQILSKERKMRTDNRAIFEMVKLYEENFQEMSIRAIENTNSYKEQVEFDFLDWLNLLRDDSYLDDYKIEDVLAIVKIWNDITPSALAQHYNFICYSLLGFDAKTGLQTSNFFEKATEIRTMIDDDGRYSTHLRQNEWLGESGNVQGIKRLKLEISSSEFTFGSYRSHSIAGNEQLCTGAIVGRNLLKRIGRICLDVPTRTPVYIHFVPCNFDLEGQRFAGQRVEFNLLFTLRRGYEAHNIKLLRSHQCGVCRRTVEFTSQQDVARCMCGSDVIKDELNCASGR